MSYDGQNDEPPEPYRIDMSTGAISYVFWINEYKKRVSGVAYANFKEGKRKVTARSKCSQMDIWDPWTGVLQCRTKLENKLGIIKVDGERRGWNKLKNYVKSPFLERYEKLVAEKNMEKEITISRELLERNGYTVSK